MRNHSWINGFLNKWEFSPLCIVFQKQQIYELKSNVKKPQNQQPYTLKATSLYIVRHQVHKHTLQSLSPSPHTQGFGCHSSRSALIWWSCVTLDQTPLRSVVWERTARHVIWGLCPLAHKLHLSSGPCYQSLPELCCRYGCAWLYPLLIPWLACWFDFTAWPWISLIAMAISVSFRTVAIYKQQN